MARTKGSKERDIPRLPGDWLHAKLADGVELPEPTLPDPEFGYVEEWIEFYKKYPELKSGHLNPFLQRRP